jgi:hypothetical protein
MAMKSAFIGQLACWFWTRRKSFDASGFLFWDFSGM